MRDESSSLLSISAVSRATPAGFASAAPNCTYPQAKLATNGNYNTVMTFDDPRLITGIEISFNANAINNLVTEGYLINYLIVGHNETTISIGRQTKVAWMNVWYVAPLAAAATGSGNPSIKKTYFPTIPWYLEAGTPIALYYTCFNGSNGAGGVTRPGWVDWALVITDPRVRGSKEN